VPQLKVRLRKNEMNVPMSGKRVQLVRSMSYQSTVYKELGWALDAEKLAVTAAATSDCEFLLSDKTPDCVFSPEVFPVLVWLQKSSPTYDAVMDTCTKNCKTGCQQAEDGHVARVRVHPGLEGLHFCMAS
jgi:hypothetical protein